MATEPIVENDARQSTSGNLIIDEADTFNIHRDLYTNENLFRKELVNIFHKCWLYVGHTSEIPNSGDYVLREMGRQPVIVSRDDDGEINVIHNRCSHRGAAVCRVERGNAEYFRCFYHNWIYSTKGDFVGLPQRSGYAKDFQKTRDLSLRKVERVGIYRGFIFASLNDAVEPLEERLEQIGEYLDMWTDRAPNGTVTVTSRPERYEFPGNWKFQGENGVDGYHGNFVHESYAQILERAGGPTVDEIKGQRNALNLGNYARGFNHGDGLLERHGVMLGQFDTSSQHEYVRALVEKHGEAQAERIRMMRNIFVFPNLYIFESHIRILRPQRVDHTISENYFAALDGFSAEINTARLREHERFYGAAGYGSPDDVEVFSYLQTGLQSEANEWVEMSRGMHREEFGPAGERVSHTSDEVPQRALYREWAKCMLGQTGQSRPSNSNAK